MKKLLLLTSTLLTLPIIAHAAPLISQVTIFGDNVRSFSTNGGTTFNSNNQQVPTYSYGSQEYGIQAMHQFWSNSGLGIGYSSFITSNPAHISPIYLYYQQTFPSTFGLFAPKELTLKFGRWDSSYFNINGSSNNSNMYSGNYFALILGYPITHNFLFNIGYQYLSNSGMTQYSNNGSGTMSVNNGSNSIISLGLSYNFNFNSHENYGFNTGRSESNFNSSINTISGTATILDLTPGNTQNTLHLNIKTNIASGSSTLAVISPSNQTVYTQTFTQGTSSLSQDFQPTSINGKWTCTLTNTTGTTGTMNVTLYQNN